ncbi:MAG TPA: Fic family protein [Thermoplasmatales archaeon]|nr:Fic family protein [Thermoplasmatales archaeon]
MFMVSIKKRIINGRTYYYLEHSYRKNSRVYKKERYIGSKLPKNIDKLKEKLLLELYEELWFKQFDEIKNNFDREKKKLPKSIEKKEIENFTIKFTYATNRIEGSSLTLRETALLLEKGITPSRRPIEDVKETENHQKVFYEMLSYKKEVSLATLLSWHKKLFEDTKKEIAGKIRDYPVEISGSKYKPPYPIELDFLLTEFFDWYKRNRNKIHPVHLAALVHLKFVTIHPFGDGNGRISRLFMNYVLNKYGYPMMIIDYNDRNSYYNALERSQLTKNESIFTLWFFRRYLKEYRRYLK